jgi:hypothetical protein
MSADARPMTTVPVAAVDLLRAADASSVTALERSKATLDAKLANALQRAEHSAAALDGDARPGLAQAVAATLERERAEAHAQTEQEVAAIVAVASPTFREHFERGRRLLGPVWPMQLANAVAAVPEPTQPETAAP